MNTNTNVEELVLRWEATLQQGQPLTPEDLCRDYPHLRDEVRVRLQALDSFNAWIKSTIDQEARTLPSTAPSSVQVPGYEILGELGRGGMGVVYKARHFALKRLVALKMILAGSHASAAAVARFRSEAEAIARLQHPNIVQVFEVGTAEGRPFCALELVEGGSLAQRLQGHPLPPLEAARLVATLARAMHVAHTNHIIHRDLKPANILLAPDGSPKVTDFGLARQLDAESGQTQTGAVMGTPSYMAPEQAAGQTQDIGPLADVYALGTILYECLTGRPPFKAPTVLETLDQVRSQEPVPPGRLQPNLPRDLDTICLKCLHKQAGKRYASAGDLASDLQRFLENEPILARPIGRLERWARWARRRPAQAALLALSVLAGLMILGLSWHFTGQLARQNEELAKERNIALVAQGQAEADREKAQVAEAEARAQQQKVENTLIDMETSFGLTASDHGQPAQAALWFGHAAGLARNHPASADVNRLRQRLWDRTLTRPVRAFPHPGQMVPKIDLHPAERHLMTLTPSLVCTIWNIDEETKLSLPCLEGKVTAARWSPDGNLLVIGTMGGQALEGLIARRHKRNPMDLL